MIRISLLAHPARFHNQYIDVYTGRRNLLEHDSEIYNGWHIDVILVRWHYTLGSPETVSQDGVHKPFYGYH